MCRTCSAACPPQSTYDGGRPLPAPGERGNLSKKDCNGLFGLPDLATFGFGQLRNNNCFFGFSVWLPSLLHARGVEVTKSLAYSALIALTYPLAPFLLSFFADRIERKWQIVAGSAPDSGGWTLVRGANRHCGLDYLWVSGDAGQHFNFIWHPYLPQRIISYQRACARYSLCVFH